MKSGIYLLTFSTATCYIGKSVDISVRYHQHLEKFRKGTHSKRMQAEYVRAGEPKCEVVCLAHPDHIDILESLYIDKYHRHYGDRLLNTQFPELPTHGELLMLHQHLLQYSTGDHIYTVIEYENKVQQLTETVKDYRKNGKILPKELELLRTLEQEVKALRAYRNLPWWSKIFK